MMLQESSPVAEPKSGVDLGCTVETHGSKTVPTKQSLASPHLDLFTMATSDLLVHLQSLVGFWREAPHPESTAVQK